MIFERWDTVVVPFPFTDRAGSKRRPALVLSSNGFNGEGYTLLAMITTSREREWPGDTRIGSIDSAGLTVDCFVRLKLFTLDNRLVLRRLGTLGEDDRGKVDIALRNIFLVHPILHDHFCPSQGADSIHPPGLDAC